MVLYYMELFPNGIYLVFSSCLFDRDIDSSSSLSSYPTFASAARKIFMVGSWFSLLYSFLCHENKQSRFPFDFYLKKKTYCINCNVMTILNEYAHMVEFIGNLGGLLKVYYVYCPFYKYIIKLCTVMNSLVFANE